MKKLNVVILPCLIAFTVFAAGCAGCIPGSSSSEDEVTSEGANVNNPLGLLKGLGDLANKAEELQAELENMTPVDPVHFSTLIEALPDAPSGWTAGKPKGATNQMGGYSLSNASNTYEGPDGKQMTVQITDMAFNQAAYLALSIGAGFSQETTEGYNKGITVGDDPGREEFNTERKTGKRNVAHGKRYNIEVGGRNIMAEDLDSWYKLVKKDTLPLE